MFFTGHYSLRRRVTQRTHATNGTSRRTFLLVMASTTLAVPIFFTGVGPQMGAKAAVPSFEFGPRTVPASRSVPGIASKPLLFVSNGTDRVDIFLQAGKNKLVGHITGLSKPAGMTTDAAGNLYVTNYGAQGAQAVPVYAPPYNSGPYLTLSTPVGYLPYAVAVSRKGVVAVAIVCTDGSCSIESFVSFFAKGSTTPCATISLANPPVMPYSVAFDHTGNLFLVGQIGSGPYMSEISGGCSATTVKPLTAGNSDSLGGLFAVGVNQSNQVAVLDTDHGYLCTYNHPKHGSFGNPVYTTTGLDGAVDLAFTASGRDLFAIINSRSVSEIDYPSGVLDKTFNLPSGGGDDLAVTPALVP